MWCAGSTEVKTSYVTFLPRTWRAFKLGNCSTRLNDSFAVQDGANCLIRIASAACRRTNNGSNGGIKIGTPVRAEPARDLAIRGCRSQLSLTAVVVRRPIGMLQKCEQAVPHSAVPFSQALAVWAPRRQSHDHIQIVIQPSQIGPPRALGQALAAPRQHNCPQQQRLHARGEDCIPRVDGVLAVT